MARFFIFIVLISVASFAWGSPLPGLESCGQPDGAACGVADHSLLQVASRRVSEQKLVELLEIEHSLETGAAGLAVNRTILNITRALKGELLDLGDFTTLLALGRHKLCAAMAKNSDRVKVLMHLLKVQALLQIGAVPTMKTGEALLASQEAESANARSWPTVETGDSFEKTIQSWWKPQPPKETDIVTEAVTDVKETVKMPDNRTLSSITADVGTEVADVERVMHDTQAEGDRLEVVATEIRDRVKILISILEQENQQCDKGGEYSYGGLLQAGKETHDSEESSKQKSVALQAATAHANHRLSREELQKYLRPAIRAKQNITFWNITSTIRNITTQLESDVNALVWEKNKLSVAGQEGFSHLDNLRDTMRGQHGARAKKEPVLALQVGESAAPGGGAGGEPRAELRRGASRDAAPTEQTEEQTEAQKAEVAAQLAEDINQQASSNSTDKEGTSSFFQQVPANFNPLSTPPPPPATTTTTRVPNVEDVPITNLAFGVDAQVVNLEADVSVLAEQKRKVCRVAQTVLEHLKVILKIAESVAC